MSTLFSTSVGKRRVNDTLVLKLNHGFVPLKDTLKDGVNVLWCNVETASPTKLVDG